MTIPHHTPFHPHLDEITKSKVSLVEAPWNRKINTLPTCAVEQARIENHSDTAKESCRPCSHIKCQLKEPCGQTVGYQIRHEQKSRSNSKIIVMTEGST